MHLTFEIPGPPVPKGRPRVTRRGTFTPQKTKDYEQAVAAAAMVAYNLELGRRRDVGDHSWEWDPKSKYSVDCSFHFKKRPACDGDNILKAVQDGLEKVLYENDKQVVMGSYRTYKGSGLDVTYVTVKVLDDWE